MKLSLQNRPRYTRGLTFKSSGCHGPRTPTSRINSCAYVEKDAPLLISSRSPLFCPVFATQKSTRKSLLLSRRGSAPKRRGGNMSFLRTTGPFESRYDSIPALKAFSACGEFSRDAATSSSDTKATLIEQSIASSGVDEVGAGVGADVISAKATAKSANEARIDRHRQKKERVLSPTYWRNSCTDI